MTDISDLAEIHGVSLRINYEKFLENKLTRVRSFMKKHNLDAILCLTDTNICYVTNVPPFPSLGEGAPGAHYAIVPINFYFYHIKIYFSELFKYPTIIGDELILKSIYQTKHQFILNCLEEKFRKITLE